MPKFKVKIIHKTSNFIYYIAKIKNEIIKSKFNLVDLSLNCSKTAYLI
jgi:hypothetical protein